MGKGREGEKTLPRNWEDWVLEKTRHLHALRPGGLGGYQHFYSKNPIPFYNIMKGTTWSPAAF